MPHSNSATLSHSAATPSVGAWIAAVAARQHALITRRPTARDDERRDRVLVAAGWAVLRFTDRDVYERPGTVRAALAPYGVSLTPSRAA